MRGLTTGNRCASLPSRSIVSVSCHMNSAVLLVLTSLGSGVAVDCTPRSRAEVAARISEILHIVRNDPECDGPIGLLVDRPTAKADHVRHAHRRCNASVATKLNVDILSSRWGESAYSAMHAEALRQHTVLHLGSMRFVAQQYWDLIVWDIFFKGAPQKPRYFFEAGARNGILESNTHFFERYLGWTGLLVEPSVLAECVLPYTRPRAQHVHGAFCRTPFLARPFDPLPPGCDGEVRRDLQARMQCFSWTTLAARYEIGKIDLWSLDLDNEDEQVRVLTEMLGATQPSVILIECRRPTCAAILKQYGYHVLILEDSGKHERVTAKAKGDGTLYGDVLAWRDTCAAWKA